MTTPPLIYYYHFSSHNWVWDIGGTYGLQHEIDKKYFDAKRRL